MGRRAAGAASPAQPESGLVRAGGSGAQPPSSYDTLTRTWAEVQQHWKPLPPTPVSSRATTRRMYSPDSLKVAVVLGFCSDDSGRVNVFETTWFSIYCSDSTPSTRCNDDRSSGGRGRATTACCESSGVPVVGPGASWRVVFDGGLIHTAVGKVSGRGGPLTNRSGCAA